MFILNGEKRKRYYDTVDRAEIVYVLQRKGITVTAEVDDALEDLVGDAIVKFDKTKNTKITTWICYYVFRQIRRAIYKSRKFSYSLDACLNNSEHTTLYNFLKIDEKELVDIMAERQNAEILHKAIGMLDDKGQFVMNFILNEISNNNYRWKQKLGRALVKNGYFSKVSREWMRTLGKIYFEKTRINYMKIYRENSGHEMVRPQI